MGGIRETLLTILMLIGTPHGPPDAKRIAFTSGREWNRQIYVMDADGGNQRNLSNNDFDESSPSWSPDGKRILFVSTVDIYVMDADGGNPKNLTHGRRLNESSPSWSPDGKRIVFVGSGADVGSDIYVMDADGANPRNLTNNPDADKDPSWSPNGKRIAFSSTREWANRHLCDGRRWG